MKNFFRSLVAVAVLFGAASCTTEDLSTSAVGGGESVELTITANLAQIGTRTLGDGTQVDRVYLGVYENGGGFLDELTQDGGYAVDAAGKATIPVVLLKNKKYDLVFWAQNDEVGNTCYTVDWTNRKLSVDYTNVESQVEKRDAFFLVHNGFEAGKDETTFKLNRPFAQLNAGLSAEEVTNVTNNGVVVADIQSKVTVEVAKTMSFAENTGAVSDIESITFAMAAKPTESLSAANGTYNWLSMNYLLVNDYKLVNVAYEFLEGGTTYKRNYASVPVQRNYRTNIIGALLSSTFDFNVEIVPGFTNDHEVKSNVASSTELLAAIKSGMPEITLSDDITINETLVFEPKTRADVTDYTLNLNGKAITNTVDSNPTDVIIVKEGVTLTINGNGSVTAVSGNDGFTIISEGKVIINDGTYRSGLDATNDGNCTVYARGKGEVYIYGGDFSTPEGDDETYVINKKDADKATTKIVIYGGTFKNFDPALGKTENPTEGFVAEGYKSVKDGDLYVVVPATVDAVASTSTAVTEALAEGKSVVLSQDVEATATIQMSNAEAVLDGNGKSISGDLTGYYNSAVSTVGGTIKNIAIVTGCERSITSDKFEGDLIIDNVTTDKTGYGLNVRPSNNGDGYKMIVTNSTFKAWNSFTCPATFTNCHFGQGEYWVNKGYPDAYDRLIKPYTDVVFENCTFEKGFYLDLSAYVGTTVKLVNCSVAGVALTKDMFKNQSTSTSGNQLVSELDGNTALWYEATDAVWATVVVE